MQWIVQASSRSWSGARDICMNSVRGKPAVLHTLMRILENFPDSKIAIAAPEFDRDGELLAIAESLAGRVEIYFGFSESPLNRLIATHRAFLDGDAFIRIDALNMFFQPQHIAELWERGRLGKLDCVKFPDDYPIQFTADYYKVSALVHLAEELAPDSPFQIHPKYQLMRNGSLKVAYFAPMEMLCESSLREARMDAMQLYLEPRDSIAVHRVPHGDTLSFHYLLALQYLEDHFDVLDIACGGAFGPITLAEKARHVIGADIDAECISIARTSIGNNPRVSFSCEDVTATSFADSTFDAVTSFETIEHVDDQLYLREIYRILKPGGLLLLSTPQNAFGRIPMNPQHVIEYSLQEIRDKVASFFECELEIGIKQGCIVFEGDSMGTNTFMKLRKRKL